MFRFLDPAPFVRIYWCVGFGVVDLISDGVTGIHEEAFGDISGKLCKTVHLKNKNKQDYQRYPMVFDGKNAVL